jgi:hypothetical protein
MRATGLSTCGALAMLAIWLPVTPAAAASGLEPGVHIDPGSPAEKEYVLPLNQARQTGAGSVHGTSSSAPLFGAGITPPRGGGSAPGAGSSASGSGARSRPGASSNARVAARPAGGTSAPTPLPSVVVHTARSQASSAGSGSWRVLLGGGLAILLLGGFGGTVLRHNRRPRPSG